MLTEITSRPFRQVAAAVSGTMISYDRSVRLCCDGPGNIELCQTADFNSVQPMHS